MPIPNMLLVVTEDQFIRSKFSKYVCKMLEIEYEN